MRSPRETCVISHRPAVPEDADEILALQLCREDIEAIQALAPGKPVEMCIVEAFEQSEAPQVVTVDGCIAAVYGVTPTPAEGVGFPWLLVAEDLQVTPEEALKDCLPALQKYHEKFPLLYGLVEDRHTERLRIMKLLGFEVLNEPLPLDIPGATLKQVRRCLHV